MSLELKKDISDIIETLKNSKKYNLAKCVEENWEKTAREYSKELNTYIPDRELEPEMAAALAGELGRIGFEGEKLNEILRSLYGRRILQTAPHLSATEGPRMFCIHWLSSLGVGDKDYYAVGMFSGIPFSNNFRPGRINRKEGPVNLFPSALQDALVYESKIPEKLLKEIETLPENLKKFLPAAVIGESYTKWALKACRNIERQALRKENLIYFDINKVTASYLAGVLADKRHVFYKIFFESAVRKEFMEVFPSEIMFYAPAKNGKYEEMENVFFSEGGLSGRTVRISLENPKELSGEIEKGRLCPSLLLTFIAVAFLNRFKCFGSFAQVEYLPAYQTKLAGLSFMKEFEIEKVPTANLTTCAFPDDPDLYPADIVMGKKFAPDENILFGEMLLAMKDSLSGGYFTGDKKRQAKAI